MTKNRYDALSRLIRKDTVDNAVKLSYDPVGNLTRVEDNDSVLSFTYDGLNRVLSAGTADVGIQPAVTLTSTYDAVGNRTQLLDSEGGTTQYAFDAADRLTQLTTAASVEITLSYDPAGRLEQILFPNMSRNRVYEVLGDAKF